MHQNNLAFYESLASPLTDQIHILQLLAQSPENNKNNKVI